MITNSNQYKKEYLIQLKKLTNNELAEQFNSKVGIRYFNFALQGFMGAMREELQSRKIDYTEIGDEKTISYANKIKIIDGKITTEDSTKKEKPFRRKWFYQCFGISKQAFYKRIKTSENKKINDEKIILMIQEYRKVVG